LTPKIELNETILLSTTRIMAGTCCILASLDSPSGAIIQTLA